MAIYEPVLTGPYPLQMDGGRDIRAGMLRGWALEHSDLIVKHVASDPVWNRAHAAAGRRGTLVTLHKLVNLFLILKYALRPGPVNIIEFGSFRGGSVVFFAELLRSLDRRGTVYACDTFEGMPRTTDKDLHQAGDFNDCDLDGLLAFLTEEGLRDHVKIVKGTFDQTLPGIIASDTRFALAHCDADIYEAVGYVCREAHNFLEPGGYLVFDDPLAPSCPAAFTAVEEELIQRQGLHAEQVYPHLIYRT